MTPMCSTSPLKERRVLSSPSPFLSFLFLFFLLFMGQGGIYYAINMGMVEATSTGHHSSSTGTSSHSSSSLLPISNVLAISLGCGFIVLVCCCLFFCARNQMKLTHNPMNQDLH